MSQPVLSIENIHKKEQEGWESWGTGYEVNYRTYWDDWYILREFVQNAMDEHDEAGIKLTPGYNIDKSGNLIIVDSGRGLGVSGLLMRERKTAGDLRGTFGEGLKIASLAALREGYTLEIRSPRGIINAVLVRRLVDSEEAKILYFLSKKSSYGQGTVVTIGGYKGSLYEDYFFGLPFSKSLLPVLQRIPVTVGRFQREDVIIGGNYPNRLYVRDIYVRELGSGDGKARFSYNLWEVRLNPDRNAEIDTSETIRGIATLWSTVTKPSLADEFMGMISTGHFYESYIVYNWDNAVNGFERKAFWTAAWKRRFGPKAILKTSDFYAVHAEGYGYKVYDLPNYSLKELWAANDVVPTDRSVILAESANFEGNLKIVPDAQLNPTQVHHLNLLRQIAKITITPPTNILAAYIPPSPETQQERIGLFVSPRDIYIIPAKLNRFLPALDVFYHEAGHLLSGDASDLTREHVDGVTRVAASASQALLNMAASPVWAKVVW